jgi:dTDP-4-dehydrorhamnose 3,5-epimerase
MKRLPTVLDEPILLAAAVHGDERGFFLETFRQDVFTELGIDVEFVQDNQSRSRHGIVRGMHFQSGMAKLIRCAREAILDVVVDIRRGASTFRRWESAELNDVDHHQLYCPDGFAHGFCVLSETADVVYGCSTYYDPARERGFAYDDPAVRIAWPRDTEFIPSACDAAAPSLAAIAEGLP